MSASSSGSASPVQSTACRCCLAEGCDKDMLTQYRCSGVEEVYADMLKETFDLELLLITEEDPDSHYICDDCIMQLRQAFQFKQRAIRSAVQFQQRLDARDKTRAGSKKSRTLKKEHIKSDDDFDDEPECYDDTESFGDDTDDCTTTPRKKETVPLKRKMKLDVIVEPKRAKVQEPRVLIKRYQYGECETRKIKTVEPNTENNEPKRAKVSMPIGTARSKDGTEKNSAKISLKTSARKKESAVSGNGEADVTVAGDSSVPDDLLMLLEWSNLCLFHYKQSRGRKYYRCFVCPETFTEAQTLRTHTESHDKSEFIIKVLHTKLDTSMIAEISFLKCKCGEGHENLTDLMTHLTEKHEVPFEENTLDYLETYKIVQNGFNCDLCDIPAFNFFGKLRFHMKEIHTKQASSHQHIDMCDECGQVFQGALTARQMRVHKNIAHGTKRTKASKAVQNAVDLISNSNACPFHWPTDRNKPHKCYCCSLHFEEFSQLRAHFTLEHDMAELHDHIMLQGLIRQPLKLDITNLKCKKCDEPCEDLEMLRGHLSARHGVFVEEEERIWPMRIEADGYKCPVCETAFDGWGKLNRHMRIQCERAAQRFECRDCSRTFVGRKTWKAHIKRIHSDDNMHQTTALRANTKILLGRSNMTMFTFEETAFRCFTCHETFPKFPELMAHSATHDEATVDQVMKKNTYAFNIKTDITDLKCNMCQTPFDDIEDFAEHLSGSHDIKFFNDGKHNLVPYFVRDGLKCGFCKQSFKSNRTLIRHVNTHISVDICDICGKSFSHTWTLRKHLKRVHGEIKCTECNITFKCNKMRRRHKKMFHKGGTRKKHECAFCNMKFAIIEEKFKHMMDEHGYELPEYTCDICFKICQTKRGFGDHMRIHRKGKAKLPCKYCDKSVVKENLEEHIQSLHSEGLKYRCYVCRKKFASPDLLCDHLIDSHSDDASYCPLCEFVPETLDSLVKHLKTLHRIDNKFDKYWAEIKSEKREKVTVVRGDKARIVTDEEILLACDNIVEIQSTFDASKPASKVETRKA